MEVSILISYTFLTGVLILLAGMRSGVFNPYSIFWFLYLYGTAGPLWAYYIFNTNLPLIDNSTINKSIYLFIYAVVGSFLGYLVPTVKVTNSIILLHSQKITLFRLCMYLIIFLNAVALFNIAVHLNLVIQFEKGVLLANPLYFLIHRNYTLLMFILIPFSYYFKSIFEIKSKKFLMHLGFYIFYMLLTQERDFVLILISCMLIYHTNVRKLNTRKLVTYGSIIAVTFSGLFAVRASLGDSSLKINLWENFLNQGSNITITTNIIAYTDTFGFKMGYTYLQSIVNLLPSFIFRLGTPLSDWFVKYFFPTSSSGYGFSLEAEAYLNGGYALCLLFFMYVTYILKNLYIAMSKQSVILGTLFGFYFPFLLYALRGDSLMLFKGNFIAIILLFTVFFVGLRSIKLRKVN